MLLVIESNIKTGHILGAFAYITSNWNVISKQISISVK
jgi:hypothetical protein